MFVDLHIHTYFSDGSQSPEEVARIAKEQNLSVISVCDHNTLDAYDRLQAACKDAGIKLVSGVELDVYWQDYRLHLLAYNFNPNDENLLSLIKKSRYELDEISVDMIRALQKDYPQVSLEEFTQYEYTKGLGGWKGVNYLKDKGFIKKLEYGMEFYKKYGDYIPKFSTLEETCRIIKEAGGVSVLAHPANWWLKIPENFEEILTDLKNCGLEGLECYYPAQTGRFRDICIDFCRRNDMRITCGGDGHGIFANVIDNIVYDIGILKVDINELDLRGIL